MSEEIKIDYEPIPFFGKLGRVSINTVNGSTGIGSATPGQAASPSSEGVTAGSNSGFGGSGGGVNSVGTSGTDAGIPWRYRVFDVCVNGQPKKFKIPAREVDE